VFVFEDDFEWDCSRSNGPGWFLFGQLDEHPLTAG
jgi:hypothetical protein